MWGTRSEVHVLRFILFKKISPPGYAPNVAAQPEMSGKQGGEQLWYAPQLIVGTPSHAKKSGQKMVAIFFYGKMPT